jgi:hypothetical protein
MEPITGGKLLSAKDTLRLGLASTSTRERIVADIVKRLHGRQRSAQRNKRYRARASLFASLPYHSTVDV